MADHWIEEEFLHISRAGQVPEGLVWTPCIRLATEQEYTRLPVDFSVESRYGTLNGRPDAGDVLMRGATGVLYPVSAKDLRRCYRDMGHAYKK